MPERIMLAGFMALQLACYVYYICYLPVRYDESLSYVHFIGKGFATTASYYPFPNNHVLHNLFCCLFVQLPLRTEVAMRLTSLLFSLASSYWFYKLARSYFGPALSLIALSLLTCSYPFILYATQARGYSMLIFFTITVLYAALQLMQHDTARHRALFAISVIAGMYTIPSFLYPVFSANMFLLICIFQKRAALSFTRFFIMNALSCLAVFCLYIPLFYVNGFAHVLKPNEDVSRFGFSDPGLVENIVNHMKGSAIFLTGIGNPLILLVFPLLIALLAFCFFKNKDQQLRSAAALSIVMLASPLLILLLHRVIPFERTWTYLVVPAALGAGLIMQRAFAFIQPRSKQRTKAAKGILITAAFLFSIYSLYDFKQKHGSWCFPEYMVAHSAQVLAPDMSHIHSIAYSKEDWEYYPAEILYYEIYKRDRRQSLRIDTLKPQLMEDLVILHDSELEFYREQCKNYKQVDANDYQHYTIFLRK